MSFANKALHRDGAILVSIHLVGLSYFLFFLVSFLLWHFPTSPGTIVQAQAVTLYSSGVILWCLCSLAHRVRGTLYGSQAVSWLKLEQAGTLFLIYTTTVPLVILSSDQHGYLRLAYLFCFTIAVVGTMTDFLSYHLYFCQFCLALGSFALLPPIYILRQPWALPSPLVVGLIRLAGWNLLAGLGYLARGPERLGLVGEWKPSLYLMHLAVILNSISYGRYIWDAAI
ncbi:uncharacterized protein LDX57_007779 [Aspergillus melleus]|uniref:uncharacterized protein n=1 Tax=Aspergillus melleus TaxID=138277 RepID=UPI001E8CB420|nr:uncharacterized protein LDX57_007779 [Aspergillus melleus]KAH8430109.1 hypothetical protein LDX57_007779 [Aspergillus melleus]